jgi:hypothetical protein
MAETTQKTRNTPNPSVQAFSGLKAGCVSIDQNRFSAATREEPIMRTAKKMHSALIQNCFLSLCFCVVIFSSFLSVYARCA